MTTNVLSHRTIMQMGKYADLDVRDIPPDTVISLLRQMLRLRRIEEALVAEYHPADEMRCPVHFCIGQESAPAALSVLLRPDDYVFSHHRSHGYYFARQAPMRELFAEIYGKSTGASGGRAGSQDISHSDSHFYSGAILAGAVSIAAGAAFGLMTKGTDAVAVSGFGEAATDEGAFWEVLNYAGYKKLPLLLVCENNRYSTYSDQLKRHASDNISERARAFGVRATQVFGNDVAEMYRTVEGELRRIRQGDGPALVEGYTHRWGSHVGPEDDSANNYRSAEELQFWKDNCPIELLRERLVADGLLTRETETKMETEIADEIAGHFEYAKSSPFPETPDWAAVNLDSSSPVADKLLGTADEGQFNQFQADAKLGPY